MQPLRTLIGHLEAGRSIHISILDFNGVLDFPLTRIDLCHVVHSKRFCDIAKSTVRGYKSCMRCKFLANRRAVSGREAFCGQCYYGLYEAAVPVVRDNSVIAIVYVGNAIVDEGRVKERIARACRYTGVAESELLPSLSECERIDSEDELLEIGELVRDYLKALLDAAPMPSGREHWIVSLMKRYAREHTHGDVSLWEFAVSHQKNAQYIGRLFKSEMSMSFGQYCNEVRLERAANAIYTSEEKIIDIALASGFQNISYFNKLFREKYGVCPSEYRERGKIPK